MPNRQHAAHRRRSTSVTTQVEPVGGPTASWQNADGWPFWTDEAPSRDIPLADRVPLEGNWINRFKLRTGLIES